MSYFIWKKLTNENHFDLPFIKKVIKSKGDEVAYWVDKVLKLKDRQKTKEAATNRQLLLFSDVFSRCAFFQVLLFFKNDPH
jgi:hypothetical protein